MYVSKITGIVGNTNCTMAELIEKNNYMDGVLKLAEVNGAIKVVKK